VSGAPRRCGQPVCASPKRRGLVRFFGAASRRHEHRSEPV